MGRGFSKKNTVYLKNSQPPSFCLLFFFVLLDFLKSYLFQDVGMTKSANRFLSEEKYTVVYFTVWKQTLPCPESHAVSQNLQCSFYCSSWVIIKGVVQIRRNAGSHNTTGKRKEMPAEVMPTSLSTAVSRPGLWSERNNLPFLQSKANFILPKQPGRSNSGSIRAKGKTHTNFKTIIIHNLLWKHETISAIHSLFLTLDLCVLLVCFSVKLLHIRTSCYSFLCKLLFFSISFKITCHLSNINTKGK